MITVNVRPYYVVNADEYLNSTESNVIYQVPFFTCRTYVKCPVVENLVGVD